MVPRRVIELANEWWTGVATGGLPSARSRAGKWIADVEDLSGILAGESAGDDYSIRVDLEPDGGDGAPCVRIIRTGWNEARTKQGSAKPPVDWRPDPEDSRQLATHCRQSRLSLAQIIHARAFIAERRAEREELRAQVMRRFPALTGPERDNHVAAVHRARREFPDVRVADLDFTVIDGQVVAAPREGGTRA